MNTERNSEEYSFLQEKIKNRKHGPKISRWISISLLLAIALLVGFFTRPWVEQIFEKKTHKIEMTEANGKVSYVGIKGTFINEAVSQALDIPMGLYVEEVEVDSAAMKAGIKSGDVITAIDGEQISSVEDAPKMIIEQDERTLRLSGQRYGITRYVDIEFYVTIGLGNN